MFRNLSAQLFDAPAEIVIAHGRVVLAAISLVAITVDPTEPQNLAQFVAATLILYAGYAVAVLAALHWRIIYKLNDALIHAIDLAVLALLLFLTEGFSSPFLVFFPFALLAASLRWDWQGIALTMVVLVLLAGIVAVINYIADGRIHNVNDAAIRAGYLIVAGTILAYASAHREHERGRLAKLAHWPAPGFAGEAVDALANTLGCAAAVLDARGALVVWDENGRGPKVALWLEGRCRVLEDHPNSPAVSVAPDLETLTFSRTLPHLDRLNLIDGCVRDAGEALRGKMVSSFCTDFASAPFQGLAAAGRLFILGKIRASDDHLPITSVIADRVGAELDRQIFLRRAAEGAAMRERAAIMRDLHDGLLQSLTAARTHLALLPTHAEPANAQLETVRNLLRTEQQRIREFVDATRAADDEVVGLETLRPLAEDMARLWGCALSLVIHPNPARVSRRTINQLSLMLAEAVANAVRHGEADEMQVAVACKQDRLELEVRDDGHGFPDRAGPGQRAELVEDELPRSLHARIKGLGGWMRAWTSTSGAVLHFELPL